MNVLCHWLVLAAFEREQWDDDVMNTSYELLPPVQRLKKLQEQIVAYKHELDKTQKAK